MSYKQLTHKERYKIKTYKQAGFKFSEITKNLDVHKPAIYREISCNRGLRGYRPNQADKRKRLSVREKERIEAFVGGFGKLAKIRLLAGVKGCSSALRYGMPSR